MAESASAGDEIYEPVFHEILEKRMKEEKNGPRIPVKLTVSQLKRQSETRTSGGK